MIVLGFDTATPATAVGLMLDDGSVLEARDDPLVGQRPGHSTRLLPLAHQLLDQAGLGWSDIDRIAVGVGPGTFTGLRIGVATARGLAKSLGAELVGVSSLQALAHGVPPGQATGVLSVIDARRGEVFVAAYGTDRHELLAPRPLAPAHLGEMLHDRGQMLPDRGMLKWLAVGDGALRYAEVLRGVGVRLALPDSPFHRVAARAICALGTRASATGLGVLPDYRRAPDAQPASGQREVLAPRAAPPQAAASSQAASSRTASSQAPPPWEAAV